MIYVNRTGAEYYVVGDQGVDFDSRRPFDDVGPGQHGLYFRDRKFLNLSSEITGCLDGERGFDTLTLDAEQAWNESGWKEPHASLAAAERFCAKALEEQKEIDDAFEEWWETKNPEHFIEEIGDYRWCITAIASNAGIVTGDAVKTRLYEYALGTKEYADGAFKYPDWYDTASALAIKREPLTLGDLDRLLDSGFIPSFSPATNRYEDDDFSPTGTMFEFVAYAMYLRGLSNRLYSPERGPFQGSSLGTVGEEIAKITAEVYLKTAAMAHYVGSTLTAAAQMNIEKITQRVSNNLIDKSDGIRLNQNEAES